MKIDPYNHQEKYFSWKEKNKDRIDSVSKTNSDIILNYINDMEYGLNVGRSSKKGARSYIRLNNLKQRIIFLIKKFEELYGLVDITKMEERTLHQFFTGMRNGTIKRLDGKTYKSPADYVKIFKAFWHWHQKVNRKKGIDVEDTTLDLDTSKTKPDWVYLTEEEIKTLCDQAKHNYKVLIMFLFDTGIRAPTELFNIKVSDLYNDCKELDIREEISKTFGRRIKLMLSSDLIKNYIKDKGLLRDNYLFPLNYYGATQYIQRLSSRLFGDQESQAGEKYSKLTLYDFRHISCCYWLPRYKSESALKYRFGWKKSDKIHYYSEMLGMRDTIAEEDMLMDLTKTEIEKRLLKSENEKEILNDRVQALEGQMKAILQGVEKSYIIVTEDKQF